MRKALSSIPAALLLFASTAGLLGCMDQAAEHRTRANAFLRGGDAAEALKECDLGLADKKDNLPLLILRGKALFELDRLDDAKEAFGRAVEVGKNEEQRSLSEAFLGLAMVASRQHDWPGAKKHFSTLVAVNPKDAISHLNVARACLEMKDLACAIEHGEEAGKLRGNEEPVLYTLGTIYLAADKSKEAELTFQHICEVIPGASSCPYGLALVAAKSGDKAKALSQLDEAIKRKVPNPDKLAIEPGFASLKDDPAFQALVDKAQQK
ncbi:MAG: tetratricopeptide repeat protein [Byssovorax sp.]